MKIRNNALLKFSIVAIAMGVLSPSVSLTPKVTSNHGYQMNTLDLSISLFSQAEAKRDGAKARKGGTSKRNKSTNKNRTVNKNRNTNVNKNVNKNRTVNKNRNTNVNKNVNKNVNVNRNVNKNVNVNVKHNNHGRYGHYHGRPLVAFGTALAVGTMVAAATMPTTCTVVVANGISYKHCGNAYYQPFQEGDVVVYKVVNSPY